MAKSSNEEVRKLLDSLRAPPNPVIRVGPGIYYALKHMNETQKLPMGATANLMIYSALKTRAQAGTKSSFDKLPKDIQTMVMADMLTSLGEVLKILGLESIKNTPFAETYNAMLNKT